MCSPYVAEPETALHRASAGAKLAWAAAGLAAAGRGGLSLQLGVGLYFTAAAAACLPRRLWLPQLGRAARTSAAVAVMMALTGEPGGPDAVGPAPLLDLGLVAVTPRSLHLAVRAPRAWPRDVRMPASPRSGRGSDRQAGAPCRCLARQASSNFPGPLPRAQARTGGLLFGAFQSTFLCLTTTAPEAVAGALAALLHPLGRWGLPVRELELTLLLAVRFVSLVRCCRPDGAWRTQGVGPAAAGPAAHEAAGPRQGLGGLRCHEECQQLSPPLPPPPSLRPSPLRMF